MMQRPDAIIAVPADEIITAQKFKEVASQTKLILIHNIPKNFTEDDYSAWISVNERDNGQNIARILKNHFKESTNVKIGMLVQGNPFFTMRQRDFYAERYFASCKNLTVVEKVEFHTIDNTYFACRDMMRRNPQIRGLYVSWERPALAAVQALRDLGREDVVVSTGDLDYEISSYLSKNEYVIGVSSQHPFEQGTAAAVAAVKAMLGKSYHKCIGVQPHIVNKDNLEKAWQEIVMTRGLGVL